MCMRGYEHELHFRIRAEFAEMHGGTLTLSQASRLFNLAPGVCELVLDALVREGALCSDGSAFGRPRSGR
jgi:hypothetical protein